MARERYNKRERMEKANMLFEDKYLKDKGLLTEQTTVPSCYICSGGTVHNQVFTVPFGAPAWTPYTTVVDVIPVTPDWNSSGGNFQMAIQNGWNGCGCTMDDGNQQTTGGMATLTMFMTSNASGQGPTSGPSPTDLYWETDDIPNILCGIIPPNSPTTPAYSCFGGQMVSHDFPQLAITTSSNSQVSLLYGNNEILFALGVNPSYYTFTGINDTFGQPSTDVTNNGYQTIINTGIPVLTNQVWFTDQTYAQLLCQSGMTGTTGTTTTGCTDPSLLTQAWVDTNINQPVGLGYNVMEYCNWCDGNVTWQGPDPIAAIPGTDALCDCCNVTTTGTTGDWWCPMGVAGPGPCIQSPTNPQPGMATGPYPDQQTCDAQCGGISGCLDPNTPNYDPNATLDCSGNPQPAAGYGDTSCCGTPITGTTTSPCMELWVTKCAGTSPGHQIGQSNLHFPCPVIDNQYADPSLIGQSVGHDPANGVVSDDVYTIDMVNPNPNYPAQYTPNSYLTTNVSCTGATGNQTTTTCDFTWMSPCAQSELNTGGQNSWDNFLTLRETGYNSAGCQHLQNVLNWTTSQLNSGVTGAGAPLSQLQIDRKTEMREWAQCQAGECGCGPLNVPPLTGGPTPPPPSAPPQGGTEDPKGDNFAQVKPRVKDKGREDGFTPSQEPETLSEEIQRMKSMWKHKL